jgi:hypothetical protein
VVPEGSLEEPLAGLLAPSPADLKFDPFPAVGGAAGRETCALGAPLILVSQQSRSGGTLFVQLLDGHPELHVYPNELTIGVPTKIRWPEIELDRPSEALFRQLCDMRLARMARKGYRKRGKVPRERRGGRKARPVRHPFDYDLERHLAAFRRALPARPDGRRQVLDAYFSSFFEAWRRWTMTRPPHYLAGFVPEMASRRQSVAAFFEDYPDGRLVSIVRDPADWFVSRRAHTRAGRPRHADLRVELRLWRKMALAALAYAERYPERVFLLRFEDLVRRRETVMRRFAAWAGLSWHAGLTAQTFDGQPIPPNGNFPDAAAQTEEAVMRRRAHLSRGERLRIWLATWRLRRRLGRAFSV